ncbi:MAG: hypothetical protein JF612_14665, partial [Planctomycetia bacterium]|nr:hypothetical protein [Planctomycetia bacterium]
MNAERALSGTRPLEAGMDELRQELEEERDLRQRAVVYARSLEEVLEALTSPSLEQLLPRLLRVFVDHVRAAAGVLWLRDGAAVRLGSALGLSIDVGAVASLPLTE